VLSYCGRLQFGLIGDRELAPDLGSLGEALLASFAELEAIERSGHGKRASRKKTGGALRKRAVRALH
jgi:hypothetical protein